MDKLAQMEKELEQDELSPREKAWQRVEEQKRKWTANKPANKPASPTSPWNQSKPEQPDNRDNLAKKFAKKEQKRQEKEDRLAKIIPPTIYAEEAQDGAQLFADTLTFVDRFAQITDEDLLTAALWGAWTHGFELASIAPQLDINSPTKGCGKSNLLRTIASFAYKPLRGTDMTPSVVMRISEKLKPSLFMDEMDTRSVQQIEEMRSLLNGRHTKGEHAWRTNPNTLDLDAFHCFGPTCYAGIGKWRSRKASTLDERILHTITMERQTTDIRPMWEEDRHLQDGRELAARWARWWKDNAEEYKRAYERTTPPVINRAGNNWKPMLALASLISEDALKMATTACVGDTAEREETDVGVTLLQDIYNIFAANPHMKHIQPEVLVAKLHEMEESPWKDWGSKGLSSKKLSNLLKTHKTSLGHPLASRMGPTKKRLWMKKDFEKAWSNYNIKG